MALQRPPVVCVACSVFKSPLEKLRACGELAPLEVQYLNSMLHMRPAELCQRLEGRIARIRRMGSPVVLLFGECHAYMSDVESLPGVARVPGLNCAEILLGSERYRARRREGAFFVLPEWLARWREIFGVELGLDRETSRDLMTDFHTYLLYVDVGAKPLMAEQMEVVADLVGLPWQVEKADLEHLRSSLCEVVERIADEPS